jgi:hypothetical protein
MLFDEHLLSGLLIEMWFNDSSDLLVSFFGIFYKIESNISNIFVSFTQEDDICKVENAAKESLRYFVDCLDLLSINDFGVSVK